MTIHVFTHHLPGETLNDVIAAERDFYFDRRSAVEATPKGAMVAKALLTIPAGHLFTVRPSYFLEGDTVYQVASFENARSICIGSGGKHGRVRVIEKGTEAGPVELIHPAAFYASVEAVAS